MKPVENWVRYQYYPSNKEYRIANLSCIYKSYKSSSGDYLYIEKIQNESNIHFEIYMKNYQKICLKYSIQFQGKRSKRMSSLIKLIRLKVFIYIYIYIKQTQ